MFRAIALILALLPQPAAASDPEGRARVRDGDSLDVGGVAVRLFGIDAPERGQNCDLDGTPWPCGTWAREVLERAIAGQTLRCSSHERDRYDRIVATCTAAGADIGRQMVLSGAAAAYTRYSDRYLPEEALARAAGRGIWGGRMVPPSEHRGRPAGEAAPAPDGCVIKGNISANGRIFHLPGQRDYAATRISPGKGEAWFCTVRDARAAGFRPAAR
jgi:endonuclease YncB( thermonuclease family)